MLRSAALSKNLKMVTLFHVFPLSLYLRKGCEQLLIYNNKMLVLSQVNHIGHFHDSIENLFVKS